MYQFYFKYEIFINHWVIIEYDNICIHKILTNKWNFCIQLNGKLTLGENIADNGGLKESWLAYEKWLQSSRKGKPEPFLPGLDYTPKQLFYLNAAHVWCGLVRPDEAARRILTDPHGNFKSRVIGPLQNNEDFSKAFNCAVGSYMNPRNKCIVW